jgi:hypothetical protein
MAMSRSRYQSFPEFWHSFEFECRNPRHRAKGPDLHASAKIEGFQPMLAKFIRMVYTAGMTQTIEVIAAEVADRLKRLGIGSDELVRITIESERELIPGRREARARVVAAGLGDEDIDRLIKQAQNEVEPSHTA